MAILRAAGRLQADDALDLYLRSAPAEPNLVRQLQQGGQVNIGKPEAGEGL
jgi:hypothetical protein